MRLLLDTSYLLPLIGVSIKGLPQDALIRLMDGGHQISISEITIFELSANGAKHFSRGKLTEEKVSRGIRALVHDERITRVPLHDRPILSTALRLRETLDDFVYCLILSSALNESDAMVTEDTDIHQLGREAKLRELIQEKNPQFQIQTLRELL